MQTEMSFDAPVVAKKTKAPAKAATAAPAPVPAPPTKETFVHVVAGHRELDEFICSVLAGIECTPGKNGETYLAKLTCGQIERYEEVDEILKRIGGKWAGRSKAHAYPFDPSEIIQAIAENGFMPARNPLAFFPTPRAVMDKIFEDSEITDMFSFIEANTDHRILEPSAGTGAFVKYLLEKFPGLKGRIDCVEIDPLKCRMLAKLEAGHIYQEEFEAFQAQHTYRAVIMNPPFSVAGNKTAYITHITKAMALLGDGFGILVAIAPTGFIRNSDRKSTDFRNLIAETGTLLVHPSGDFKESGTMIETATITLFTGPDGQWKNKEYQGYTSHHSFTLELYITNERDLQPKLMEIGKQLATHQEAEADENIERLIATTCDRIWKETHSIVSLREEIKAGIKRDLLDSARSSAADEVRNQPPMAKAA